MINIKSHNHRAASIINRSILIGLWSVSFVFRFFAFALLCCNRVPHTFGETYFSSLNFSLFFFCNDSRLAYELDLWVVLLISFLAGVLRGLKRQTANAKRKRNKQKIIIYIQSKSSTSLSTTKTKANTEN